MIVKKALTIAGSDSSGGAGIQADLKTFQELKVYGMSVITAVTAQNTLGVSGVYPMSLEAIEKQLDCIAEDIQPDALKTGMLFNNEIIELVAHKVEEYKWTNFVIDPVMIAKGGANLLQLEAIEAMKKHLLPLATIITPNIPEAEELTGRKINSLDDRKEAAKELVNMGVSNCIIKGGHGVEEEAIDLLYDGSHFSTLLTSRIQTKNTHGTGCTFSAAITASLAKGDSLLQSFQKAKEFIHAAIKNDLHIGNGHGPTNHWAYKELTRKHLV
ncbi:bifunctional hydroxymethylpyrimidine kinase/phosphomethylpyrimidine kinase [Bacillus sp. B1-b2]|uniref:bifunctional hydroxymethylpyrimidine kinase/phosphomethylpyrimidine kinase n=1 Tax=Bacillus sp. B1-b2 TaxID=2653201 RepID=UPI00126147E1|nr:bifunctional hydroxymethylpyrimidine kinase/phosphomethylpyrimidine kinase [Bacillus sp. B1-b2]KAB7673126.1 bifunctional hydroxymethylpyrimidine kinase/phosphomethylpyrimidine kinase [Bacillus sp. B1-b2]